jgi:RNA-binding protein
MFTLRRQNENASKKEEETMSKYAKRKPERSGTTVERPTIIIGKKGSTDFLSNEVSKQLGKRKVVKVKILKTALVNMEAKDIAKKVAEETGSKIIQLRGHTFTLYKPKKN